MLGSFTIGKNIKISVFKGVWMGKCLEGSEWGKSNEKIRTVVEEKIGKKSKNRRNFEMNREKSMKNWKIYKKFWNFSKISKNFVHVTSSILPLENAQMMMTGTPKKEFVGWNPKGVQLHFTLWNKENLYTFFSWLRYLC